jgi:hypothetical protein
MRILLIEIPSLSEIHQLCVGLFVCLFVCLFLELWKSK